MPQPVEDVDNLTEEELRRELRKVRLLGRWCPRDPCTHARPAETGAHFARCAGARGECTVAQGTDS